MTNTTRRADMARKISNKLRKGVVRPDLFKALAYTSDVDVWCYVTSFTERVCDDDWGDDDDDDYDWGDDDTTEVAGGLTVRHYHDDCHETWTDEFIRLW